jgi:hypothetical protein
MKFLLVLPFAFILLLQSVHVGLEDVVKIPDLFEHYQEHKENYGDDLLTFLKKHYGSEKEAHSSEEPENQDLPFHHAHHFCIDLKIDIPVVLSMNVIQPDQSKHYFVYHPPHTASATHSLFQPPKNNC